MTERISVCTRVLVLFLLLLQQLQLEANHIPSTTINNCTTTDLVALYDFSNGSGNMVMDRSGAGTAANLSIADPANITWTNNGLRINSATTISGNSDKVLNELRSTNAFTIEAWVTPANTTQSGPARMITLSSNAGNRNFTVGAQGNKYSLRLRTSDAANDNNGMPNINASTGTVTTNMTHVAITRTSAGQVVIYVDGLQSNSDNRGGDFSNWDTNYTFALANEITNDRPWLGTFHRVAVYKRALSAQEVDQNFQAGANCGGTNPPTCENISSAGSISYNGDTNSTGDTFNPPLISNASSANGGNGGNIEYQWQKQEDGGNWTTLSASAGSYDPPAISTSTSYRRRARRDCQSSWINSNTITITLTTDNGGGGNNGGSGNCATTDLVALYDFSAGSGSTVTDQSGVGSAANLSIANPGNTTWTNDGLRINSATTISGSSDKVLDELRSTNAFTIEAWVTPANTTQSGPARMITLSENSTQRNFTVGAQGNKYSLRLRTSDAANDNNGMPNINAPAGTVTTNMTHVAITRTSAGQVIIYVDGVQRTTASRGGDFSNWNTSYTFALANEATNNRPWLGTFHKVAVYKRALSAQEVTQNFEAGASCGGGSPPTCDNITTAGSINYTGNTNPTGDSFNPPVISNASSASGGNGGNIEYQWQKQEDGGNWTTLSASAGSYDPPTISTSTSYRRRARRDCQSSWINSNTITITLTTDNGGGGNNGGSGNCATTDLIALYDFSAGSGSTVTDQSGVGSAANLTIANPGNTTWTSDGLRINSATTISGSSDKVLNELRSTNAFTIEAWVTPANTTQSGPARMITLSENSTQRNFTVGAANTAYSLRLRTNNGGNDDNGLPNINAGNTVTTNKTHLAITRNSDGLVIIYVNGIEEHTANRTGNFGNWSNAHTFALANEITNNRPWLGTFHKVAIYKRALSAPEIDQNYQAGSSCGDGSADETTWTSSNGRLHYDEGPVSIGDDSGDYATNHELSIDGKMVAEQGLINSSEAWPDYVFEHDYQLTSINDLRSFITEHGHLPGIPSASQIEAQGIPIGEVHRLMVEKVEEFTLLLLQQRTQQKALEQRLQVLQQQLELQKSK